MNTSAWSEVFGVPLFTWAIPTYLGMIALAIAVIRGSKEAIAALVIIGAGSLGFSLFLYYISVYELGKVCQWCLRLYAINFLAMLLPLAAGFPNTKQVGSALLTTVMVAGTGGFLLQAMNGDISLLLRGLGAIAALGGALGYYQAWGRVPGVRKLSAQVLVVVASTVLVVGAQQGYRNVVLLAGAPVIAELPQVPDELPQSASQTPKDEAGDAPLMSFEVKTEDGNIKTLKTRANDAWKGNPNAKVAIVEFADFQCGYCKRASSELKRVHQAYKDDVVFIFKHFPMSPTCNPGVNNNKHRYACSAAIASVCAKEQQKFWPFHDLAFKNQHQLKTEHLRSYAEAVGMDVVEFDRCVRNPDVHQQVRMDGEHGASLDIHGTPRVYINGKLYRAGTSAQQYARAVEAALKEAGSTSAKDRWKDVGNIGRPKIAPIPPNVADMQQVKLGDMNFYMDTFEASLLNGAAHSGKHEVPGTRMSWYAANEACQAAGKRMCSEKEWIAACQGAVPIDDDGDGQFSDDRIEGNAYPYADYHERGYCWDAQNRDKMRPVYTGEMPGCVTVNEAGYKLYDLTANVEEWVGATEKDAVLLGGAYDTDKDFARCYRRNDTFGPGFANMRTGFRCCKNAQ